MNQTKLYLSAICAAVLTAPHGWAQPPVPAKAPVDVGKKKVEFAPKQLIAEAAPAPRPVLIDVDNPWVEPGKVRWHDTFEAAKKAAATTSKPVLLFQMMGRLDQQFT
jgi:hypothetical protein